MKQIGRIFLLLAIMGAAAPGAFADDTDTPPTPEGRGPAAVDETHPIYSTDAHWVATVLIAIGGLFLAAMVVGPIVRAESPEVVPVAMSHEEDPAADRVGHAEEGNKP